MSKTSLFSELKRASQISRKLKKWSEISQFIDKFLRKNLSIIIRANFETFERKRDRTSRGMFMKMFNPVVVLQNEREIIQRDSGHRVEYIIQHYYFRAWCFNLLNFKSLYPIWLLPRASIYFLWVLLIQRRPSKIFYFFWKFKRHLTSLNNQMELAISVIDFFKTLEGFQVDDNGKVDKLESIGDFKIEFKKNFNQEQMFDFFLIAMLHFCDADNLDMVSFLMVLWLDHNFDCYKPIDRDIIKKFMNKYNIGYQYLPEELDELLQDSDKLKLQGELSRNLEQKPGVTKVNKV